MIFVAILHPVYQCIYSCANHSLEFSFVVVAARVNLRIHWSSVAQGALPFVKATVKGSGDGSMAHSGHQT